MSTQHDERKSRWTPATSRHLLAHVPHSCCPPLFTSARPPCNKAWQKARGFKQLEKTKPSASRLSPSVKKTNGRKNWLFALPNRRRRALHRRTDLKIRTVNERNCWSPGLWNATVPCFSSRKCTRCVADVNWVSAVVFELQRQTWMHQPDGLHSAQQRLRKDEMRRDSAGVVCFHPVRPQSHFAEKRVRPDVVNEKTIKVGPLHS